METLLGVVGVNMPLERLRPSVDNITLPGDERSILVMDGDGKGVSIVANDIRWGTDIVTKGTLCELEPKLC